MSHLKNKVARRTARLTSVLLAVLMILTVAPIIAFPASAADSSTEFIRIVHIDCGRQYFKLDELKRIVKCASESNYTHVELAFGNDGLRFLLDDMSLEVGDVKYDSNTITTAIKAGNKAYSDTGSANELTQTEMDSLIEYAKSLNIGIIPMFDAPGHLQTVVKAMGMLGLTVEYTTPTTSGTSVNYAITPTDTDSLNFVAALMEKYMVYFSGKGCTMFNIAADECGFADETYTAYAEFVNKMAQKVIDAGMTPLAFNDGIYHVNLKTTETFDDRIKVCYWDASTNKYASAATLAGKGFSIINTHNKWYYVPSATDSGWYGYNWSESNMNGTYKSCTTTDGGYETGFGCMNAIWFDTPYKALSETTLTRIENHIKLLATNNPTVFTESTVDHWNTTPSISVQDSTLFVGQMTNISITNAASAEWTVEPKGALEFTFSDDAKTSGMVKAVGDGEKEVTATITATVDGTEYTAQITILPDSADYIVASSKEILVGDTATLRLYSKRAATWEILNEEAVKGAIKINTVAATQSVDAGVKSVLVEAVSAIDKATVQATVNGHALSVELSVLAEKNYDTEETITIAVGETKTVNIVGEKLAGTYDNTADPSIATVKVTDKDADDSITYSSVSVTMGDLAGSNTSWTKTEYYYKPRRSDTYYPVYAYKNVGNSYTTYYYGYITNDSDSNVATIGTSRNSNNSVTVYKKTGPTPASTDIVFEGVSAGDTSVVIGRVKYNIKVIPESLDGVAALPIQLWITDNTIEADGTANTKTTGTGWGGDTTGKANYISVSAEDAYGESGVLISTILGKLGLSEPLARSEYGGTRFVNNTYDNKPNMNLVFWLGRIHDTSSSNIQTVYGTDYSNSGYGFQYIRYYKQNWQVSLTAQSDDWVTVTGKGSTGTKSGCTEQLVAYFMIRTDITQEVSTDVSDWGYTTDDKTSYDKQISDGDYVILDYAVKYEGGTRNPETFPQNGKTLVYHCVSNNAPVKTDTSGNKYRILNNFRGVNLGDYEIYMITVTMTDTLTDTSSYEYIDSTEKILWVIDDDTHKKVTEGGTLTDYEANDSDFNGGVVGGDPSVRGVEIYNQHGALITYYIRVKETPEDSLEVRYVNLTTGDQFYQYIISVNQGTYFNDKIDLVNGKVEYGDVVNRIGRTETVSSDLSTMIGVPAEYRYATNYTCVKLEKTVWDETTKTNIKVVTLYYTFNNDVAFVIDFGLSLVIEPKDLSKALNDSRVTITKIEVTAANGWATIDTSGNKITYTPTRILPGRDVLKVTVYGNIPKGENGEIQEGEVSYTVTIVPASTVYYEEGFIEYDKDTWTKEGDGSGTQSTDAIGSKKPYGYDDAYSTGTNFSMGSHLETTVGLGEKKTASFVFTGDGFDLISATSNATGAIFVYVYDAETNELKYQWFVDTYYGYGKDTTYPWIKIVWTYGTDSKWHAVKTAITETEKGTATSQETPSNPKAGDQFTTYEVNYTTTNNGVLYQIPVISKSVAYGTYKVVISAAYYGFFDHANAGSYTIYIDGVRIYNTLESSSIYNDDVEKDPTFTEVRDIIISADDFGKNGTDAGAVFIDGFGTTGTVDDFKKFGPNNEVYLANGQGIAFNISIPTGARIFIGAKSPNGSATLYINGEEFKVISTATDMYYDITGLIKDGTNVISNNGDGILSITTIKVTNGTATPTVSAQTISEARIMLLNMIQPEVPVFTPERFEASWSTVTLFRNSVHALMVRTSTDVDHITVDGKEITNFYYAAAFEGWGRNRKLVKYKVFTLFLGNDASIGDYEVVAFDADGVASEAHIATLTGKTGVGKFN